MYCLVGVRWELARINSGGVNVGTPLAGVQLAVARHADVLKQCPESSRTA